MIVQHIYGRMFQYVEDMRTLLISTAHVLLFHGPPSGATVEVVSRSRI